MANEDKLLEERKEKVIQFFKENPAWIFYLILVLLVILGVYIRMQPLVDHGGRPGLWDITTNDYTLGPDLDPFLFLRYAKTMISEGSLLRMDIMRNVPLGFDTTTELQMVSYMIVLTYKLINLFGTYSIDYAGALMPVIFFVFTIIAFFLFVREIFARKGDRGSIIKANIISAVSTLFMIVIPGFLSRTVAGIPEKESVGFFFMFLAFYLFLKAWKSEKTAYAAIFGVLAGLSTALMGLTWGGVTYIYASIAVAFLVAIILNKVHKKEAIIYLLWVIVSLAITFIFTNRFSFRGYITSLDTGLVVVNLVIIGIHFLIWNTRLSEKLKLTKINLPKPIISIIIAVLVIALAISIALGPGFIFEKLVALNRILIAPIQGRWSTTVAENRQPYFAEWVGTFGRWVFWFFVSGSVLLFYKTLDRLSRKDKIILTACYVFFLFGLIFSRYAAHPALLDGEGFISKLLYYGSFLVLVGVAGYYYVLSHRKGENLFESVSYEMIFLFSLFILTLFTARSAVRLIMVLAPIAPIFMAYLIAETGNMARKASDKTFKAVLIFVCLFVIVLSAYQAYGFYKETKATAYNFIPSSYTVQWQKAMSWVRDYTPEDAVFAHWWDYGYWLQSIGNRATVTDGGNIIVWWNYLTGRLVLTGDNQKDALEFLYNHNATHLLIDSTDIGKYGAYSQIGSDENFDRISQGPFALISDEKNIQETKTETIRMYNRPSGNNQLLIFPIEEDINYVASDGQKINLFKENSGLVGITLNYSVKNNLSSFNQPIAVFVSRGGNYVSLPVRYLKYNSQFYDFGSGIESAVYIIQRVSENSAGLKIEETGALIYLSPRVMRGLMGQLYILDDPLKRFTNFRLAHLEPNLIIDSLNAQGAKLRDFVYLVNDVQGPIKIWNITYSGNEKLNSEYTQREVPAYISWEF